MNTPQTKDGGFVLRLKAGMTLKQHNSNNLVPYQSNEKRRYLLHFSQQAG